MVKPGVRVMVTDAGLGVWVGATTSSRWSSTPRAMARRAPSASSSAAGTVAWCASGDKKPGTKPGFCSSLSAGLLRLGCLLGVFQLLAGFFSLLLHALLQAALGFGELRFGNRCAIISAGEAFE